MTVVEWLLGGGGLIALGGLGAKVGVPWLRDRLRERTRQHAADAAVRVAEVQRDAAREEREDTGEVRTIDRLWTRVESLEERHADCERRNTECERRATRTEAKAIRLENENTVLARRLERVASRLPEWDDDETDVGRQVARIARRTPTPPDHPAVVEEVRVSDDDDRREEP